LGLFAPRRGAAKVGHAGRDTIACIAVHDASIVVTNVLESDDRDRSCAEVDQIANAQLTQVRSKLADLSVLQNVLQALIGQCRHGTIADCRIIEALAPTAD
jgi:hypothetical protein